VIVLPWRWDETPDMSYTSFCPNSANLGLQPQQEPQHVQSQDRVGCPFLWEVCVCDDEKEDDDDEHYDDEGL
jgi:hypothetical protein